MKKLLNLENAIYFLIIILPSYLIRLVIFGLPTNLWEVLAVTVLFWWAIKKKDKLKIDWKKSGTKYLLAGLFLITFGLIVSTLVNKNYLTGFGIIKSWLLVPLAFSLMAIEHLGQDRTKNIFKVLYISAFGTALISLGYYILGKVTYDGRLEAFFNSPNYLAMYLSPAVIIAIYLLKESRKQKDKRKIVYISLGIILLALFFTYSYAAWFSVILALIILLLIAGEFRKKYLLAIILVGLLLVSLQKNSDKLNSLMRLDERSSLASRVTIWNSAERMVENNWLWGIGPGNFEAKYLEYQKYYPPYLEWAAPHPHNLYLAFWLYGGISGFAGFLTLLYLFITKLWQARKKEMLGVVSMGIVAYFLVHGIFDTTYFKNDLAVVFWLAYLTSIRR